MAIYQNLLGKTVGNTGVFVSSKPIFKMMHVPYGGGGNFRQYTKVGTASVAHDVETTKKGYLTFKPGGMFTISWSPKLVQFS